MKRQQAVEASCAALLAGLCTASAFVMSRQMTDDAYIYLRMAQNLIHRGEWAFNPGVPVNAATSPLYELLLAALTALPSARIEMPLILACAVSMSALAIAVYRGLRGYGVVAALAAAFFACSFPTLLQAEGLETALYLACIALTALAVEAKAEYRVGMMAGLTALGRPEGGIMIPVALGVLWWTTRRMPWRGLLLALIPVALWLGFCLHTFHGVVPHTMKIKALQAGLANLDRTWWQAFAAQLGRFVYLAPLAVAGCALAARSLRERPFSAIIVGFGILQSAAYAAMRAPLWYFWYSAPGQFAYRISLAIGFLGGLGWVVRRYAAKPERTVNLLLAMCLCAMVWRSIAWERVERYPYRFSPEYVACGMWLRQRAAPTDWLAADEIGYLGVYSAMPVRDMMGLADPESIDALSRQRWDFWFSERDEPRFILMHTPPAFGEPGNLAEPWPDSALAEYQDRYRVAFVSGRIELMERE